MEEKLSMRRTAEEDNRELLAFWDAAFRSHTEEETLEDWHEIAPSRKLFDAAASLGTKNRVLDLGCGSGWASIIAAKSGCPNVTAADAAEGAAEAAFEEMKRYGVSAQVRVCHLQEDSLRAIPAGSFDGVFCSNVLDVVPPETAEELISEMAFVSSQNASVIIGLNYCLTEGPLKEGMEREGDRIYVGGILRLVSHTDEEWAELFAPYFTVERLEHFAWPGEAEERRRLFYLKKK